MKTIHSFREFEELAGTFEGKSLFVKATAAWCRPCKLVKPFYDKIAENTEAKSLSLFTVFDIDKVPELSEKLKISSLPTFACIQDTNTSFFKGSDPVELAKWVKQCIDMSVD